MSRQFTPLSNLDSLKKEAKRWLHAIRDNHAASLARLKRSYPDCPANPTLRHVQHAIALEHGFNGWSALKDRLAANAPNKGLIANDDRADIVNTFLENACADPIL